MSTTLLATSCARMPKAMTGQRPKLNLSPLVGILLGSVKVC